MSKYKITYDLKLNLSQEQCLRAMSLEDNKYGTLDGIIKGLLNDYLDEVIENEYNAMLEDMAIREEIEREKNKAIREEEEREKNKAKK